MKKLNNYINEAWGGVKKQTSIDIEAIKTWCEEMGIQNYTINPQGEIDVDGDVRLQGKDFKELSYKFGKVNGYFDMEECKNLISLKNCPDKVEGYFCCIKCNKLESLEGCPKEVGSDFYCYNCKRKFIKEKVGSLCKVKKKIFV